MEADEVYSTLSDKLSDLQSKLDDNSSRFDALRSDLSDLKSAVVDMKSGSGGSDISDLKSGLDRVQSDIAKINDALASMKSGVDTLQQATGSSSQSAADQFKANYDAALKQIQDTNKRIDDANAAADKKMQDQAGLIGKLGQQAEDAGKMLTNLPDTIGSIAQRAVDDGKKQVLSAWEDSKKEILGVWSSTKDSIMGSLSSVTTPLIKEAIDNFRSEIKDELKNMIADQILQAADDAKHSTPVLTDDELDEKIEKIVKLMEANKS
jgi:chromosome segregation ATPase